MREGRGEEEGGAQGRRGEEQSEEENFQTAVWVEGEEKVRAQVMCTHQAGQDLQMVATPPSTSTSAIIVLLAYNYYSYFVFAWFTVLQHTSPAQEPH